MVKNVTGYILVGHINFEVLWALWPYQTVIIFVVYAIIIIFLYVKARVELFISNIVTS